MRTRTLLLLAILATLLASAGPAWADHRPNNEVLVGGAISQTGRYAEPAGRQVNSIKLWADDVNARGGLLGHKIALRLLDDKSDTQTSIKLYEKLITEDKVDVVLGPYSSGITEAVANVTERYKMPFVAYGASSTPIWEKGRKYIFNIVAVAEDYQKGALHLAKQAGVKSIAIIGEDSLFPRQAAKGAKDWAKKLGIDVVVEENYPLKQTDFTALLQKIKASGAEAVISNSYFADAAAQLRQMREQNANFKLYSSTRHRRVRARLQPVGAAAPGAEEPRHEGVHRGVREALRGEAELSRGGRLRRAPGHGGGAQEGRQLQRRQAAGGAGHHRRADGVRTLQGGRPRDELARGAHLPDPARQAPGRLAREVGGGQAGAADAGVEQAVVAR
jgi:hypothetical protein